MKCNVGGVDRVLRIIVGIALIGANFLVEGVAPWGYIGVIPLVTALIGWCPLYLPLGIKTCKSEADEG